MKKFVDSFLIGCGIVIGAAVGLVAGTKIGNGLIDLLYSKGDRKSDDENVETEDEDDFK